MKRSRLTFVLGEADGQRRAWDLLGEDIVLVEEEDEVNVGEPRTITYGVEQFETLLHAILRCVFLRRSKHTPRTVQLSSRSV